MPSLPASPCAAAPSGSPLDEAARLLRCHRAREAARLCDSAIPSCGAPARLLKAECLVSLALFDEAQETLAPLGPAPLFDDDSERRRFDAVRGLATLGAGREKAARLWRAGAFDEGRALYATLREEEARLRRLFQPHLDADPADAQAWSVLLAAFNKDDHIAALTPLLDADPSTLPARQRAACAAFLRGVAGASDHAAGRARGLAATTFFSIPDWPCAEEKIPVPLPEDPESACALSSFSGARATSKQIAATAPWLLRLRETVAYDSGVYLTLRTPEGRAPWLQEGVWGQALAAHAAFVLPPVLGFAEGTGLGTALACLPPPQRRIREPVVALGYWNNYGHVLHDVLPQIEWAEAVLGPGFRILAVGNLMPAVRAMFALMGYGAERFVTVGEGQSVLCDEAWCVAPRTRAVGLRRLETPGNPAFRQYDVALSGAGLAFVRERLMRGISNAPATRQVYASRGANARRPDNEALLEKALAAEGFEIIVPESLTLEEQVRLFAATKTLVALEGASLANMLFMPEGSRILSLRSPAWGWTVNVFDELARIRKLDYATLDFPDRTAPVESVIGRLKVC